MLNLNTLTIELLGTLCLTVNVVSLRVLLNILDLTPSLVQNCATESTPTSSQTILTSWENTWSSRSKSNSLIYQSRKDKPTRPLTHSTILMAMTHPIMQCLLLPQGLTASNQLKNNNLLLPQELVFLELLSESLFHSEIWREFYMINCKMINSSNGETHSVLEKIQTSLRRRGSWTLRFHTPWSQPSSQC